MYNKVNNNFNDNDNNTVDNRVEDLGRQTAQQTADTADKARDAGRTGKNAYNKARSAFNNGRNADNKSNNKDTSPFKNDNKQKAKSANKADKNVNKTGKTGAKQGAKSGANTGAKAGTKASATGAKAGTKAGAKAGAKAGKAGAKAFVKGAGTATKAGVKAVGGASKIIVSFIAGFSSIIVPLLIVIIVAVIVINSMLFFISGQQSGNEQLEVTEAQEIMYVFNSFVKSSNDKEKNLYDKKLSAIKSNGLSATLCAVYKTLAEDYYYTNISEILYTNYDKDAYDSAYENAYNDYVARYYLSKTDGYYEQKSFDSQNLGYYNYVNDQSHYRYCNNILKMCIDAFINSKTNKIYKFDKYDYVQYYNRNKESLKNLSKEDKEEKFRKRNINIIIHNLEGKKSGLNRCCIFIARKDESNRVSGESIKDIKKNNVEVVRNYLSQYIYTGRKKYYNFDNYTLNKSVYNSIYDYDFIYKNGNEGSGGDICEFEKSQIGKKGSDFCNGQTKAWSGGLTQWCAIFQAYCLEQVGVNPSSVGWSASCSSWIQNATQKGIYRSAGSNYKPQAGDILFFSWGHVGLVYSVNSKGNLVTIEGNTDSYDCATSKVAMHKNVYSVGGSSIRGYLCMSKFYSIGGSGGLASGTNLRPVVTDASYKGGKYKLTKRQRTKMEHLVYNENGCLGYAGCLLVAQCLRDAMLRDKSLTPDNIRDKAKYEASDTAEPNGPPSADAKRAVQFIFDKGGYAVKHRILYFYNPYVCEKRNTGSWHETQLFVVECGKGANRERFFDAK